VFQRKLDLGILNGTLSRLQRESVIMNHPTISNLFRQMAVSENPAILQQVLAPGSQGGHANRELLDRLNLTKERGFWKGMFAIYGPSKAAVDTSWESVQDAFEGVPGVKFGADYHEAKRGQRLKIRDMPEFEIPHNGFPRLSALPMMDTRGYGGGHICFSPLFPPGGKELYEWYKFASQRISEENFDLFADFHCYGRYTIAIVVMVYGPTEGRRADALYEELMVQAHEEHQTSEYRTHIDYMSKIASHFDFNDGALNKFVTG
jgi:4-cresol dehydrogenase (hydroxylating)